MNDKYIELMTKFYERNTDVLRSKDKLYNSDTVDLLDYFPKGWNSCLTYINENLLRLDSMISNDMVSKDLLDEKFGDLLNYVQISYVVMLYELKFVEKNKKSTD